MTTTENRPTAADGHLLVDRLVADGLPRPRRATVRIEADELALSLTLDDETDFAAWAAQLDSDGAVDPGPWRIAGLSWRVAVGRVRSVRVVLAVEVEHAEEEIPAQRPSPSPHTTAPPSLAQRMQIARAERLAAAGLDHATVTAVAPSSMPGPVPPGPGIVLRPATVVAPDNPPGGDVLLASSSAAHGGPAPASGPAPSCDPAPESETTGDHAFRDLLGPDGRPRPTAVGGAS